MWKLKIIFLLSLVPQALLQTTNDNLEISDAATESNLCLMDTIVSYTITEETPLKEYGDFADHYKKLGIRGSMREVNKTKLEPRHVCCPGYFKGNDGTCQGVLTTTNSIESSTDNTLNTKIDRISIGIRQWIMYAIGLALTLVIILFIYCIYSCNKKKMTLRDRKNNADTELAEHEKLYSK